MLMLSQKKPEDLIQAYEELYFQEVKGPFDTCFDVHLNRFDSKKCENMFNIYTGLLHDIYCFVFNLD